MNANCPRCNWHNEDMDHLLRGCIVSKNIWTNIAGLQWVLTINHLNLVDWIRKNLKSHKRRDPHWCCVFVVTLWQIWKDRKKKVFDNIETSVFNACTCVLNYVAEINQAFLSSIVHAHKLADEINWYPPLAGKIKLNTDGCARGDPGEGGFGGLFRDETGIWLCGFFGKLETCYSLEAEM